MKTFVVAVSVLALTSVACSDDPAATAAPASSSSGTGGEGGSGSGANGGEGGSGGSDGGAGGAGGEQLTGIEAHDCTIQDALDLRGTKGTIQIAAPATEDEWTPGHHVCVIVDDGVTIEWDGDMISYPLRGGISPDVDDESRVTIEALKTEGRSDTPAVMPVYPTLVGQDFPYFSTAQPDTMRGVIYVR